MGRITGRAAFMGLGVILLFLFLTFDPTMAQTFLFFLFFGTVAGLMDSNITYPIEGEPSKRYFNIALGVGSVFAFYFLANIILPIFGNLFNFPLEAGFSVQSLFSSNLLFSQYALAGKTIIVLLAWGILIPITENLFVIRLYEGLLDIAGTHAKTIAGIFAGIAVATGMALYHIQSKGATVEASAALFVTLLFFAMIIALTVYTKDHWAANAAHITANMLALGVLIKTLELSPYIGIAIGIGLLLFLSRMEGVQSIIRKIGG